MTDNFLSEARRQALIKELMDMGCKQDQAERVSAFPTEDADDHLYAHACIMSDAATKSSDMSAESPKRRDAYIRLSAACFDAITKEADARNMTELDFPKANAAMTKFIVEEASDEASEYTGLSVDELLTLLKGKVN